MKIKQITCKINIHRLRNISSGLLYSSVTILSQILLVPIFISLWGKDNYGEWLLLSTIPAYLSVSDIGVNVTTTTAICTLIAQNKEIDAIRLYKSANSFFLLLTFIFMFLFIITSLLINMKDFIGIKKASELNVEISLFFLIIAVFISHFIGLSLGIYRSEGRFDKYQNTMTILLLSESVITLLNVVMENSVLGIAISCFVIRLLFWRFIIIDISTKYQWFRFGFSHIRYIFSLLPTSIYYTSYTTGYNLILQGTSFIVGKNLGVLSLVTFNTTRTLVNSIRSLTGIFYGSFLPEYTVLLAKNNHKVAKKLFLYVFIISFIISAILAVIYFFSGEWFMYYWTKGKVKIEQPFFSVMLFSAFISTISICSSTVLNATNNHRIMGIFCLVLASISLIIIYYITSYGLTYVSVALLTFDMLLLFLSFYQALKTTKG